MFFPSALRMLAVFMMFWTPMPELMAASPESVSVVKSSRAGTGCPANQKIDTKIKDKQWLHLDVPSFAVAVEANSRRKLVRKNCQVIVEMKHSDRWQVSPEQLELIYTAISHKDVSGEIKVSYYLQGDAQTINNILKINENTKAKSQSMQLKPLWSKCGKSITLVVGVAIKLRSKTKQGSAQITLNKLGPIKLKWRRCQ